MNLALINIILSLSLVALALASTTAAATLTAIDDKAKNDAIEAAHASSSTNPKDFRRSLLRQRRQLNTQRSCLLSTDEARFDTSNIGWTCSTSSRPQSARCTYSCSCAGSPGDAPWCCGGENHYCSNNQCVPLCSSTESPSSAPSEAPTAAPTPIPENNDCTQAQFIDLKPEVVSTISVVGETERTPVEVFGTTHGAGESTNLFGLGFDSHPAAVWYSFTGTGRMYRLDLDCADSPWNASVKIFSTTGSANHCNEFDSGFYTGSGDMCLAEENIHIEYIPTQVGTTYLILVEGYDGTSFND